MFGNKTGNTTRPGLGWDLRAAYFLGQQLEQIYARGGGRDQTLDTMSDCGTSTSRSKPWATKVPAGTATPSRFVPKFTSAWGISSWTGLKCCSSDAPTEARFRCRVWTSI